MKNYPPFISIANNGKDIAETNFWESEMADAGKMLLSYNAGCFRLLVPQSRAPEISDMRKGAKHVVISVLWPIDPHGHGIGLELLIEDGTDSPWVWGSSLDAVWGVPSQEFKGAGHLASVWGFENGRPQKYLERKAYVRFTDKLPCVEPLTVE